MGKNTMTVQGAAVLALEACGVDPYDPANSKTLRKVEGLIKQHVHHAKYDVYDQMQRLLELRSADREYLELKAQTHKDLVSLPSEKVLPWPEHTPERPEGHKPPGCVCEEKSKKCPKHWKGVEL